MAENRLEKKLGFNPKKLKLAITSTSPKQLSLFGEDLNKFVRARVAGNVHINEQTHLKLLNDLERGVVLWALKNIVTKRRHVDIVIENNSTFCPIITPALAGHTLLTSAEKERFLLMIEEYKIQMGFK